MVLSGVPTTNIGVDGLGFGIGVVVGGIVDDSVATFVVEGNADGGKDNGASVTRTMHSHMRTTFVEQSC